MTVRAMAEMMDTASAPISFVYDDGGRADGGFAGEAGDCVTRAIAIALDLPYREVYDELARRMQETGKPRSARNGIHRKVYEPYLTERGWRWVPTMSIGSGCTVHLNRELYEHAYGELVYGPALIVRLSKHVCAVKNNAIRDNHDPSRGGTRCVYGYFKEA